MTKGSTKKQEQERMLRVHPQDATGVQLQQQADAMVHEMLQRLFEISTSREKLKDFGSLLKTTSILNKNQNDENQNEQTKQKITRANGSCSSMCESENLGESKILRI